MGTITSFRGCGTVRCGAPKTQLVGVETEQTNEKAMFLLVTFVFFPCLFLWKGGPQKFVQYVSVLIHTHTHTHISSKPYVGVTASTVCVQAGVDDRTRVSIALISISAHTPGSASTQTDFEEQAVQQQQGSDCDIVLTVWGLAEAKILRF